MCVFLANQLSSSFGAVFVATKPFGSANGSSQRLASPAARKRLVDSKSDAPGMEGERANEVTQPEGEVGWTRLDKEGSVNEVHGGWTRLSFTES